MPVTVKQISLWRKEAENVPGSLAQTLEPLAAAGANLQLVMGYRFPGDGMKAAFELYPVSGKKPVAAAQAAGLSASSIPTLIVQGNNSQGLAHRVAKALSDAGVDMGFFVGQVIGNKYAAVIGFANEADSKKAAALIKKAAASKKK